MITKRYYASFTAGTAVSAATSGMTVPAGCQGVIGISKGGDATQHLEVRFPGQQHRYGRELVPCAVSIPEGAVNTREETMFTASGTLTPCYWRLPPGTDLEIIPRGGESGTAGVIYCQFAEAGDPMLPPLHWEAASFTLGTTADDALLTEVQGARKLGWAIAQAAGLETAGVKYAQGGEIYIIPGADLALNAPTNRTAMYRMGQPVPPTARLYWSELANSYTGTAAGKIYTAWEY